jgi:N-acetyl sugar amidotransferase
LDKYRSKDGSYDVLVPVSGGKDSASIAHKLKHEYGMHPLTATWAPNIWTDIGRQNHDNFVKAGFDNVLGQAAGDVNRKLVRLAFEHMGDPFQPFIYGVHSFPIKTAIQYGIRLIMYAEDGEVEYGGETKNQDKGTIDLNSEDMVRTYFSNYPPEYWKKFGITDSELQPYYVPTGKEMDQADLTYRYFAHYEKWVPQENFYYAAEHCGFQSNTERSEGTYSKYASLDDRLDGFHYYLGFIKFGLGRANSDASHEIRDGHLSRKEGVALIKRFDGEFPAKYFEEFLEYINMTETEFWEVVDKFRSDKVWKKSGDEWVLRCQVE